ncbi:MAG: AAA family ATPase, partial [Oligoflexia bacterium]|nr:AAA family ATPase [Oligoflexia bacterium]
VLISHPDVKIETLAEKGVQHLAWDEAADAIKVDFSDGTSQSISNSVKVKNTDLPSWVRKASAEVAPPRGAPGKAKPVAPPSKPSRSSSVKAPGTPKIADVPAAPPAPKVSAAAPSVALARPTAAQAERLTAARVNRSQLSPNTQPFFAATKRILTNEIADDLLDGSLTPLFGRDHETQLVLDTLIRPKGSNAVLVGEAGVGKTTVAEKVARAIVQGEIPEAARYQKILGNAIVVEATPSGIGKVGVEDFLRSLKAVEQETGRKVVLYVDELHQFSQEDLDAFKSALDSRDGPKFIGSTTFAEYNRMVGSDAAIRRRFQTIDVPELSVADTKRLLRESAIPYYAKEFATDGTVPMIGDDAIDALVKRSGEYLPDSARPEGPIKLLQDVMVREHRRNGPKNFTVSSKTVGSFVSERLRLPLDPSEPMTYYKQLDTLKAAMRETVIEQSKATDALVDLWGEANMGTSAKGRVKVALLAGSTGTGKTFAAQTLAEKALGDGKRLLELSANEYKSKDDLWKLFGATTGYMGSDKNSGILPEFLDGRGKGYNVIVINEIEKASPQFREALMEMLDTGKITGGDGRTRELGKSLVVLTTNKGDDLIFPRGSGELPRKLVEERAAKLGDKEIKNLLLKVDSADKYNKSSAMPPSFVQRIDRAVGMIPPSREGAEKTARNLVNRATAELLEQHGIAVKVDDAVLKDLVARVYVPEDGLRSVRASTATLVDQVRKAAFTDGKLSGSKSLTVSLDSAGEAYQVAVAGAPKSAVGIRLDSLIDTVKSPFFDPDKKTKLLSLEKSLAGRLFGQDDAIATASRAIRSRAINPDLKTPAAMLFMGPTATGKTELAKSLADEVYGSRELLGTFDMSEIKSQADLNNFFGSPRSYVGSDVDGPFEAFLKRNKDTGGVILFDEVGNIGSETAEGLTVKKSVLQKFYAMLQEGKWVSPLGDEYDLSKFTIVMTSNDGADIYQGLTNDRDRLAAWKQVSTQEATTQILKERGWPEPLVGRFKGNIVNFKPLMSEDRAKVAQKAIERYIDPIAKRHGIKEIRYADGFLKKVGDTFFSHEQGARRIEGLAENQLTDMIGSWLVDLPEGSLKGRTLTLDLDDNYAGKTRFSGRTAPERKVTMKLELSGVGKAVESRSADVSALAAGRDLLPKRDSLRAAIHEAGHALVNDPRKTGTPVSRIAVGGNGGFTEFGKRTGSSFFTRERAVAEIAKILGGVEAEKAMGLGQSSGWQKDLQVAREFAEKAVLELGLSENSLTLRPRSFEAEQEINALLLEGQAEARRRLGEQVPELRTVAARLYRKGTLEADEFQKIAKQSTDPLLDCAGAFARLKGPKKFDGVEKSF